MLLVDKLHSYFKREFELSDLDSKRIKYSLEFLYNDFSKALLLFIFFTIVGHPLDFLYAGLILLTMRIFTGGLHFKSYGGCLLFSLLFFITAIYLKNSFMLQSYMIILIYIFSCLTIIGFAPIISKTRPQYSDSRKKRFKILGLVIFTIYFALYLFVNKYHPFLIYGIWVMALQSIQILIAKGVQNI